MIRSKSTLKTGVAFLIAMIFAIICVKLIHVDYYIKLNKRIEIMESQKFMKWVVVTSIQPPTPAVIKLANYPDWRMVVVGDRKSPKDWSYGNVVHLDIAAQKALNYRVHDFLPYDSYVRKVIGYLYAIEHGARIIYDTDDDNFINKMDIFDMEEKHNGLVIDTEDLIYNPCAHFGQSSVWRRGHALEYLGQNQPRNYSLCTVRTPAVQQSVVNLEPDLDAIFRMTRIYQKKEIIYYDGAAPPVILPQGTFSPYNSQNTLFLYSSLWSLVLPAWVSDRETDIYRSYWAQKLMWLTGDYFAYYPPTNFQVHNFHININDAKKEKRLVTEMGKYAQFLDSWNCTKSVFYDCVLELTEDLVKAELWGEIDIQIVKAWLHDLASVGYTPPELLNSKTKKGEPCKSSNDIDLVYYPKEQKTTMYHTDAQVLLPDISNMTPMRSVVNKVCGDLHEMYYESSIVKSGKVTDILLVVTITEAEVIPLLFITYSLQFSQIMFCGSVSINKDTLHKWKVTYVKIAMASPSRCIQFASKMKYNVLGYLHVTQNMFLKNEKLNSESRNKNKMWVTGLDQYLIKEPHSSLCKEKQFTCTRLNSKTFENINEAIISVKNMDTQKITNCINTISSSTKEKNMFVLASTEISFYIPSRLTDNLNQLLDSYNKDLMFDRHGFLPVWLLECEEVSTEKLQLADIQNTNGNEHYDYVFPFKYNLLLQRDSNSEEQNMFCENIRNNK